MKLARRTFRYSLFLLLLCLGARFCAAHNLLFERMGQSAEIKQLGSMRAIVQDADGFMWFGGSDALVRFDGIELKIYGRDKAEPKSICGRFVQTLFVDSAHQLWVGTDRGFCRYNRQLDKFMAFDIPGGPPIIRGGPIQEDASGNLYLGIRNGIVVVDKTRHSAQQYFFPIAPFAATGLTDTQSLLVDSRQRLWVGTSNSGLASFADGQFKFFQTTSGNEQSLASNNILSIVEGDHGNLWLAFYQDGVDVFNPDTAIAKHYNTGGTNSKITSTQIFKDSQNTLWFSSDGAGLLRYEPEHDIFEHQYHDGDIDTSLISNKTRGIYEDRNQGLWITFEPYGIQYYEASSRKVRNYQKTLQTTSLNDNGILCFYERAAGTILIGTEKGLNVYDPRTESINAFTDSQTPVTQKPITHITEDEQGNTWIGTWGDGLYRISAQDKKVTHYLKNDLPGSLSANIIWRILPNADRSLWLATQGAGLVYFNPGNEQFTSYIPGAKGANAISSHHINDVLKDRQGRLWIGSYGGVDRMDVATGEVNHLPLSLLLSSRIRSLLEDDKGRIWIATEDAGIFIWQNDNAKLINIDVASGLPHSFVTRLVEDAQHKIWAGTLRGLAAIDPITLAISPFSQNYGITAYINYRGAVLASRNSDIYVGGIEGFSTFNDRDMTSPSASFPVYLTRLIVNNKPIVPAVDATLLATNISLITELKLNHNQGSFAFAFAALNFHLLDFNHYQYMLEGFDTQWNDAAGQNLVTYTNIPDGRYHFRVRAANTGDQWSPQEVNLAVLITPPPWKTWWAYVVYVLVFLAIIYQLYCQQRDKIEFDKEKRLNLELLRMNRIKDEFLANTTHELRTPINGIIGLTLAIQDETQPTLPAIKEKFELIVSSGRRLSHLIDDILDYAKMAGADIVLHKSWVDIYPLVERVFSIAHPLAKNKTLILLNETQLDDGRIFVDANRIEQILLNLVSNAIKYTDSGLVKVFICPEAEKFTLVVQDSGIGIAAPDIEKLFNAFNQLEASASRRVGGTGLGLTVAKHLVEKHGGTIQVNSLVGLGSQFILRLPAECHELANYDVTATTTPVIFGELKDLTILIADDDAVNCMILRNQLTTSKARLLEAHNGKEAWNLLNHQPVVDIAVLDLHMPHVGGFELAKLMRKHERWATTPILFLTASIQDADRETAISLAPALIELKPIRKENLIEKICLLCGRTNN